MASRKIPRKLKNTGLFEEMLITSGDFQGAILPAIQESYLSAESKNRFVYFKCQAVNNELLLEKFQEKRKEMQMGDLAESVAFLCVDNNQQVEKICQEGLKTGTGSSSYLGHPRLGVHLCRHADVLRPTPLVDRVTYNLIVFKVLKGRVKHVPKSQITNLQPTPGYDCHLSAKSQYAGVPLQNLFQSTQLYLYEYGDAGILERPRHVCPIAVVQFQYRDSKSLEKSRLHQPVLRTPEPAEEETLDYVLWSGRMTVKGLFACCVQIVSPQVMIKPVKLGAILNLSKKVGMWEGKEKYLSDLTNLTTGKEFYNNGWYINVCEMKAVQPKSNYEKIKRYLAKKQCMAVVKLEDDILLIMTDNDVTFQLGLSKHSSESGIHCIFLSKFSRKHKVHSLSQRPQKTTSKPRAVSEQENSTHGTTGYKHMQRINDSYKQMSTSYSTFLSPKHPLERYPDANNNSTVEGPLELMDCGRLYHQPQSSLQGQIDATARLIEPDRSLHPPQTDLYEEIDLVESSKSPFPETYSDVMFDRNCQTASENDQSGGVEIDQQLQLSPGYSGRLAEALSLSSQEADQALDDLPPLIPWLPVNISETALTHLSSVADFQPPVTDKEPSHQNRVNTHQRRFENLLDDPDHLVNQLNRSQESITPPPTLQIETHDNNPHNNSGSSLSRPPSLECSKNSPDLKQSKTLPRSQSFEMIVPKQEIGEELDELGSNIKQIWPTALEQDTSQTTVGAETTVGEMPYSLWPRHFMDAFMEPATIENLALLSQMETSQGIEKQLFTPEHVLQTDDHFTTAGSSTVQNMGPVGNPDLDTHSIRIKTEPQYSPVSCSEEHTMPQNLDLDRSVPGNMQVSGGSIIKMEPLEVEDIWWQDFPGFQDQQRKHLHRSSSLPDINGKVAPLHEYYIEHPQLHLLLDSGFWPKPPKTSFLKPEEVKNSFVEQAKANRPKRLPKASSLVDLQDLSKLYGDKKFEEMPLQSIVDFNRSVEKFLSSKTRKSFTKSSNIIEEGSTCMAATKYKESVGVVSGKESVCIPAKRYKEPVAVVGDKKESKTKAGKGVCKTKSLKEICKKAPKVVLTKLKLHGKDSYKVEACAHSELLPTEAEEDSGTVDKNLTLITTLTQEGTAVSKENLERPDVSLQKSPKIDTDTGNEIETEMLGLNLAIKKYVKEKEAKDSKQNRIDPPVDSSLIGKQLAAKTETSCKSEHQLQHVKSPRDKKKEHKHKRKADEHAKTFRDATNVTQQSVLTEQSESKHKVDGVKTTSEHEFTSPRHKKHKHEKHKEKKSKHSHKHKENMSGDLEKVKERSENKKEDTEKHENTESARNSDLEASKESEREEIFSKALDEIVSAKVREAIGGKKRKADEEHKTTDVNKEKKIKSGDKIGTSNENRKHSKTEPERTHSKERKNKVKITAVSSSKQKAADKVLSALNMEARPVDVSSLGRIPKKQQASAKKSKKDQEKTGETGTEGNEIKEDSRQVAEQKKLQDITICKSEKMEHKGLEKMEHKDLVKKDSKGSDRGPISADDDILPASTMEDFMQKQKHLLKTVDSNKSSPGVTSNSLFSNVLKTRPEIGTIPGLGGLVDNTEAVDKVIDYSKRQVVKSASGLKCVLSGYNPVGRGDDPQKVDIVQCLKAALHGVRAKALRMDPVSKNIHEGLHRSIHTEGNKTITISVDSKGTPSVITKIELSDRLPQNDALATDTESSENNEQVKRNSTKGQIMGGSGKIAETDNSLKIKQHWVESSNRKIASSSDKLSEADLLLQIPEKMEVKLDEDSDGEDSEAEDGFTEGVLHEAEKTDNAESLNLSFSSSLKQNLVDIHKIETEKPDNYDSLCESYAGSSSKAGPEKANLQENKGPLVIEVTLTDKPKQKQKEKNTAIQKNSGKVEPVKVTVEIGGELTKKQSAEKGKSDPTDRSSLSSKNAESLESVKEPSKTTQADDARRRSRSKSSETVILSSESLSKSNNEGSKQQDSPSRRRSRSKSKPKDEIDSKPSATRSRTDSESKSSRSSREKSLSKESTTASGKNSRAGSEAKDEKSSVSRSVHKSGVKPSGSQSKDESKKEEKKSIAARLETLATKAIPASELAKADSRQSRQYHPYKKEEKKKKRRKPEWSFDMAYRDMNELLQNLTTNFFRDTNKVPAQPLRSVYSRSYNRRPRRFAGFVFHRSEVPKTPPRTRSQSPSADPESNKLTPEVIPDLKERQEKADLLEDIILETATGDGEEEEYSREQDIYGVEEAEDIDREGSVEIEKSKSDADGCKSDTPGKSLSLPALVIPGGPKTSLFSGTQLDDSNEESQELLDGTSARPFHTEITVPVDNEKTFQESKLTSSRGEELEHRSPIPDPCSAEKSLKKDRLDAKELPFHLSELEKKTSLSLEEKCFKKVIPKERHVVLKEKNMNIEEKEAVVNSEPTVQPTVKSNECKKVEKKNKNRLTLISTDSDSCLDWTDEELALDKVDETGTFMSNDEFSDVGECKSYLVVDSVGASDSDSYEDAKQEKNTENKEEVVEKADSVATNNLHSHVNKPSKLVNNISSEAACCGKTRTISKVESDTSDCEEREKTNSWKTQLFVANSDETRNESETVVTEAGQRLCANTVICKIPDNVKSQTFISEENDMPKNLTSEILIDDDNENFDTGRSCTPAIGENVAETCESSNTVGYEDKLVNYEASSVRVSKENKTAHSVMSCTKASEETEVMPSESKQATAGEENESLTNEKLPTPVNLKIHSIAKEKSDAPVSKENGTVSNAQLDTAACRKNKSVKNTGLYTIETKEHPTAKKQAQGENMAGVRYLDDTITKKGNPLNTQIAHSSNMYNRKNIMAAESEKGHLDVDRIVHVPQAVIEVEVGDDVDSYSHYCSHSSFVPEMENSSSVDCDKSRGICSGNPEDIAENTSEEQICMVVDEAVNTDEIVLAVYEEDDSGYLKEIVGVVNSGLDSPIPDENQVKEGSTAENLDQICKNAYSEVSVNQGKDYSSSPDDEKCETELFFQEAGSVNNRIADDRDSPRNTDPTNLCSKTSSFIVSEQMPVEPSTNNCCINDVNASTHFLMNSSKNHTEKIEGKKIKLPSENHSLSTMSSAIGSDTLLAESQQVDNAVLNVIQPAVPTLPLTALCSNPRLMDSSDSSLDIVLGSSDFESDLTDDTDILKQASRDIKQSLMDSRKKCNATLSEAKENSELVGKQVISDCNFTDPQNLVEKETSLTAQNPNTYSFISAAEVSLARTVATVAPLRSVTCTASILNPSLNSHCQVTSPYSNDVPNFLPASASSEQGLLPNPYINSPLMGPSPRFMSGLEQYSFTAGGMNAMTYFRPPFQSYMYNMNRSGVTSPIFGGIIPQTTTAFDISGWQNYQMHCPSSNVQESQQYNFSPGQLQPWMFSVRFSPSYSPPNHNTYFASVYASTPPFPVSYNYTTSSRFSSYHVHNGRSDRNPGVSNLIELTELTNKNNENFTVTETTELKKDVMGCFIKRPEVFEENYQYERVTGSSGNSTVAVKSGMKLSQTDIEASDYVCNKNEPESKMMRELKNSCSASSSHASLQEGCGYDKNVKNRDKQQKAKLISDESRLSTTIHDTELDKEDLSANAGVCVKDDKISFIDSQNSVVAMDEETVGIDKTTCNESSINENEMNWTLKEKENHLQHEETLNQCIDSNRTESSFSKNERGNTNDNENMQHPVGINLETIENCGIVENSICISAVSNEKNLCTNAEINEHIQSRSDVVLDIEQVDLASGYSTENQMTEVRELNLEMVSSHGPVSDHNEEIKNTVELDEISIKSGSCKDTSKMETHGSSKMLNSDILDADIIDCMKALEAKRKELQNKCLKTESNPNSLMQSKNGLDAESDDKSCSNKNNIDDTKNDAKDRCLGKDLDCNKASGNKEGKCVIICDNEKKQFSADNVKRACLSPEESNTLRKYKSQANSDEPVSLLTTETHAAGSVSKIGTLFRKQNTAGIPSVKSISSNGSEVKPDLSTDVTDPLPADTLSKCEVMDYEEELKEFYNSLGPIFLTDNIKEYQKDIDVKKKNSKEAVSESGSIACDIKENNKDRNKSDIETYPKTSKDHSETAESQNPKVEDSIMYREFRTEEKSTVCDSRTLEGDIVKQSLPSARDDIACSDALTSIQVNEKTKIIDTYVSKENKENSSKLIACAEQSETTDAFTIENSPVKCHGSSTSLEDFLNKSQKKHTDDSLNLVDKDNQDKNSRNPEHESFVETQNKVVGVNGSETGQNEEKAECSLSECYVWNGEIIPFNKIHTCNEVKVDDKNTLDKSHGDKISSTDTDKVQADHISVPDFSNTQSVDLVTSESEHLKTLKSRANESFDRTTCHSKAGGVSQEACKHKSAVIITDSSAGNILDSQKKEVQLKTCHKVMKKKKKTDSKKKVVISHKKKKKNKIELDKAVVSFYKELGITKADTNMPKDAKNVSASVSKQGLVNYNDDDCSDKGDDCIEKSSKTAVMDKAVTHTSVERLVAYDDDQNGDDDETLEVASNKNSQSSSITCEVANHKNNQYLIEEPVAEKIEQSPLELGKSAYEDSNDTFVKHSGSAYEERCIGINGEVTEIESTSDINEFKGRIIKKTQLDQKQTENTHSSFKAVAINCSKSESLSLVQADPTKEVSCLTYKQSDKGIQTKMETETNRIEESDVIKEENKGKEVLSSCSACAEQTVLAVQDTTQAFKSDKQQNLFPDETSDFITGIKISDQKCADAVISQFHASTTDFEKSLFGLDGSNRLVTDEEIESWDTVSTTALTKEQETGSSKTGKSSISLLCSAYDESSNESLMNIQDSSTVHKDFQDSLAVLKNYINEDSDSSDSSSVCSRRPNYTDDELKNRNADSISSSSEITDTDTDGQADISTDKISSPSGIKARKEKELCNDEMNSFLMCKWIQDDILSPDSSDTESVCDSPCSDLDTVKAVSDSDELYQSDSVENIQPLGQSTGNRTTEDISTEDIKPKMMSTKTAKCNIGEIPESQAGMLNQSFHSQSDASDITNVLESSFLDSPMSNMSSLSLSKLEEKRKRLTRILTNTANTCTSLKRESGECSDSDNSKASSVSSKRAHIQSWIQRGAKEKLISRLRLSEKLQEGWDSSSSDDESSDVQTKTSSKQFVVLDSLSCSDKELKSANEQSDTASVRYSSDSQFCGKQSSPFQIAVQNSSFAKSFYTKKRNHSSGSHEMSGKSMDKIYSENYEKLSVRQRSRSGSMASNASSQDQRGTLELDRSWSQNRQLSSSKDTISSHRSRESSRSSDFGPFSRSSSREVFSSSSCDRKQSDRRYSPKRESRRKRHHRNSSGTRKRSFSGKEQHKRSGNRSGSSESHSRGKNRPRNRSSSSESGSRWKRSGRLGYRRSDTNTGRQRQSSGSKNEAYTTSNEMRRIQSKMETENLISELPAAYQVDARRHEISHSFIGTEAEKFPVGRREDIRHRTSSPIYGDGIGQGDIGVLNQKEKVVILHSSALASETLGDFQELIKSLAQYSTSRCHWKALVHSRMVCDLDEWRSVNPECGKLLELMSAYREMDHVELLPFHGCDDVTMRPDRCAEQIAAECRNVLVTFLIAGSRVGIQRKKQLNRPSVSTENPIVRLNTLKKGKGIVYKETCLQASKQFLTSVTVDGETFQGSGKTKKEAKQAAAKAALIERFNVLTVPSTGILSSADPHVVICSIEEFLELHLTSKNT